MSEEKTGYTAPTKAEIAEFKKKHNDVFLVSVKDKEGKEYTAILRKPKMRDLQVAGASEKKKPMSFNQSIWANCKLAGDPAIEADDYLYSGALGQLDEIIEFAEATVKKL